MAACAKSFHSINLCVMAEIFEQDRIRNEFTHNRIILYMNRNDSNFVAHPDTKLFSPLRGWFGLDFNAKMAFVLHKHVNRNGSTNCHYDTLDNCH